MKEVTKITVNGREYDSIEQMPPDVRELYLQAMASVRNAGTLQSTRLENKDVFSCSTMRESIVYNGREYKSLDELPPEVRKLFKKISESPAGGLSSDVDIKTTSVFLPETRLADSSDNPFDKAERDPKVAWLLVKILAAIIVILLSLHYLMGIGHGSK